MKAIFITVAIIIIGILGLKLYNSTKITVVNNAKIIKLKDQQLIGKESTEYRYLIITDKGTFISESSFLNGKFDNSELFYSLKEGETYNFKVAGIGKNWVFDYQNIISYTQ